MEPIELVRGIRVESVRVGTQTMREIDPSNPGRIRHGSTIFHYNITVVYPNGVKKNLSTAWGGLGKKVARAAGLRLRGKGAQDAALEANTKIFAAVEAFRQSDKCAKLEGKAMEAAARKLTRRNQREAEAQKERDIAQIRACLRRTFLTEEQILALWREAQIFEVMGS